MRGTDISTIDIQRESILDQIRPFENSRKIGTRPLSSGNLMKPPADGRVGFSVVGDTKNAGLVMNRAFSIEVYPDLTMPMLDFAADAIIEFVETAER